MNDRELEETLNRWRTPEPPAGLRARVLANYPRRGPRDFGRLLRWGFALAAVLGLLAIGSAQSGGALQSVGDEINQLHMNTINWIGDLWVGHVAQAFLNSNPKIYVDGELRSDAQFGGSGVGVWLRLPDEGKYLIGLRRTAFEGQVPPRAGLFNGHTIEFQAGAHSVRIESAGTYGFHQRLPVYVMGPVNR